VPTSSRSNRLGENVRTRTEDGVPPQYQYLNANKRAISLNFKDESGREAFTRLAEKADVVIENYSTGTMDSLGIGYEDLQSVNPELIYGHGSGYGDDGPYAEYPAMDLTIQAMSGVIQTTGFSDEKPVKAGPAICDFIGGVHPAVGIVSALYERVFTGEGQYVEVGMFDCMYPTIASPVASWVSEMEAPPRTGNKHSGLAIAPYNVYEGATMATSLLFASVSNRGESLARLMDHEDLLDDNRFDSKVKRAQHMDFIDELVSEWVADRSKMTSSRNS